MEYDASSIEVLSGLEPVYKRPGMYTDTSSPNHIAQEVIDNSVDEVLAGHAKKIEAEITADGEMIVTDDGRGMPVDIHPQHKISGVELILTRLHSGAKFSNKNYKFSGGLHGVGISVVNALSQKLKVEVWKDDTKYEMGFADGKKIQELKEVKPSAADIAAGITRGTRISFIPNPKYFDNPKFIQQKLKNLVRSKAVLCDGLKATFRDKDQKTEQWCYKKGIEEYFTKSLKTALSLPAQPWVYEFKTQTHEFVAALAWTPDEDSSYAGGAISESYVNLIPTPLGGTHVTSLRTGIYEAVKDFCQQRNMLDKNIRISSDDVWRNINYLLSVRIDNPHFAGQTKEKLSSEQQTAFIASRTRDALILWLNSNPNQAEKIATMTCENAKERAKRGEMSKKARNQFMGILPGKLADCIAKGSTNAELFLVEGDSAGGSAKQARNKTNQAIMPLRGKILNTWELSKDRIMESQEVQDIIRAIGVMPKDEDLSGLRYDKICILADADSDGLHIASLLCALFVSHFPSLVSAGKIFIAMPPLYRIDQGKKVYYAADDEERDRIVKDLESKQGHISIQRFKGLGEMNPAQLKETTMSPATRKLVELSMESVGDIVEKMNMLFSKKEVESRRKWLEENGNLAQIA